MTVGEKEPPGHEWLLYGWRVGAWLILVRGVLLLTVYRLRPDCGHAAGFGRRVGRVGDCAGVASAVCGPVAGMQPAA